MPPIRKNTKLRTKDKPFDINEIQVGGDHYKKNAIQPWDYIASNNIGYLGGNVVKYVTRWEDKNGIEDLEKAYHYLLKLIEVEKAKRGIK